MQLDEVWRLEAVDGRDAGAAPFRLEAEPAVPRADVQLALAAQVFGNGEPREALPQARQRIHAVDQTAVGQFETVIPTLFGQFLAVILPFAGLPDRVCLHTSLYFGTIQHRIALAIVMFFNLATLYNDGERPSKKQQSRQGGEPMPNERISSVRISPDSATVLKQLGLLADFAGTWHGEGFNLIARPDVEGNANLYLQLNQTHETLKVDPIGSSIPNRGFGQNDIELFGLTYLQKISDAATGGAMHIEPGIWVTQQGTTYRSEEHTSE